MQLRSRTEMLCTKATNLYVLLLFSVFPLFTGPDGYIMLGMKKYILLLALTAVWTSVIAVSLIKENLVIKRIRVSSRILLVFVSVFAVCASVSTFTSDYPRFCSFDTSRYDGLLTYLIYCLMLVGIASFAEPDYTFLIVFEAAYTVCCFIAFLQLMGFDPLQLYPMGVNYYDPFIQQNGRFLGTLGNIDLMSAYHCMALPLAASAIAVSGKRSRFFLFIPLALGTSVCLKTGVSGGIVSLAVTVLLYVLLLITGDKGLTFAGRIAVVICCFVFVTVLILLAVKKNTFSTGTLYELHEILNGHVEESFGSSRIGIWRACLDVAREHIVKGIGPDCLAEYIDLRFERYSLVLKEMLQTYTDNAHNEYLQFFLSFGFIGILPVSCIFAAAACRSIRLSKRDVRIQVIIPSLIASLLQAFFNIGSFITVTMFIPFLAAVFACGNNRSYSEDYTQTGEAQEKNTPQSDAAR